MKRVRVRLAVIAGVVGVVIAGAASGCSRSSGRAVGPAQEYLERALALIHQHSLDVTDANWPALAAHAEAVGRTAKSDADTYGAILYVLKALDSHSSLLTPAEVRIQKDGDPSTEQTPSGRQLGRGAVLLSIPASSGRGAAAERYAKAGVAVVERLLARHPCGWIVDLRGDYGGNFWPMVTTVLPLLGAPGPVGSFVDRTGVRTLWQPSAGSVLDGATAEIATTNDIPMISTQVRVAVLTGSQTGSSGEATLVAFLGRPNLKTFGQPTAGLPSGNAIYDLSDGAELFVTRVQDADRTGHIYPNHVPIAPQQRIPSSPGSHATAANDAPVTAATRWLEQGSACAQR